jgi:hypothetical protein
MKAYLFRVDGVSYCQGTADRTHEYLLVYGLSCDEAQRKIQDDCCPGIDNIKKITCMTIT